MRSSGLLCLVFLLPMIFSIYGCVGPFKQQDKSTPVAKDAPKPSTPSKVSKKPEKWEWQITEEEAAEETGQPTESTFPLELNAPEVILPTREGEKLDVSLVFNAADVREVSKVLLGDLLRVNYVIDETAGGKLTFRMVGQFYKEEILNIFQTILNVDGLALVQENGMIQVTRLEKAKMELGHLSFGKKVEKGGVNLTTQVVPLSYITPQDLMPTLRAFMTPAGLAMAPNNSHAIVVVDTESNMTRLVAIINTFDTPFFAGKAVKFYDIKYVNVSNLAKDLKSLTKSLGGSQRGLAAKLGFIPLTDTNKLLVTVTDPEILPTVDFWINNMDVKSSGQAQLYIYKLQHKKAESMAAVLNELFEEGGPARVTGAESTEISAMGAQSSQVGPVKVIPDAESNALAIKAFPQDYQNIRRIIEVMDATPKQVLIEVLIAEVTLNDDLAYGVEYFFRNNGLLRDGVSVGLGPTIPSPLKTEFPRGTRAFFLHSDLDVLVTLLDTTTHIELLSTPRILVRHEQTATIQVGQEEPILTQRIQEPSPSQPGEFVTSNTVVYKNIGVILSVTPRIGENNMITLDVSQEVTSVIKAASAGLDTPAFTARKASTSLVVENGRTIIIGGIIENKKEKVVKRVPVLHRIPLLGNLFQSREVITRKTELLLILTPTIVSNPEEADKVTKDFENKLKAIEKLRSGKTKSLVEKVLLP